MALIRDETRRQLDELTQLADETLDLYRDIDSA
jgi:hypothetical protein